MRVFPQALSDAEALRLTSSVIEGRRAGTSVLVCALTFDDDTGLIALPTR